MRRKLQRQREVQREMERSNLDAEMDLAGLDPDVDLDPEYLATVTVDELQDLVKSDIVEAERLLDELEKR
jgi:hypothetical protein